MESRVIGLEIANSSIKAFTVSDKTLEPKLVYCPNTIREVNYSEIDSLLTGGKTFYTIGKKQWEIGIPNAVGTGGKERDYTSEEFTAQVICSITKLVEYETEEIYLVYGLPATSADNKTFIEQLNKLKGKHEVYENKRKRSFEIKAIKVISQPIGTLFYLTYDLNGNSKGFLDPKLLYMFIDGGWGTVDPVIVSLHGGIVRTDTINYGMSDYNSLLREMMSKKSPSVRTLYKSLYDFDIAVREGILTIRGGEVKIKDYQKEIETIQNELSQKIYYQLSNDGWDFASCNKIILTGGLFATLFDATKKVFGKDYSNDIILVDDPITANVKGYYTFGRKHFHI